MSLIKTVIDEPVIVIDVVADKEVVKQVVTAVARDDKQEEKKVKAKKKEEIKKVEELPLITKYRPDSFENIIGNTTILKSLAAAVKSTSRPHAYVFTGIFGIGKTTIARILAKELDAAPFEICAAVNSGIDDTRAIAEAVQFKPITGKPNMLLIVDECHNLSSKAWEPLLKLLEDAPSYFYAALCSTEPAKIPGGFDSNRCFTANLKPLKQSEIEVLVETIAGLEGWTLSGDVFNGIVQAAEGSARKALSILQVAHVAETVEELIDLIPSVESDKSPVYQLYKLLASGNKNWRQVNSALKQIEEPGEAIEHLCNLLCKEMTRSEERQADQIWRVIQCLSENRATWNKKIQLYAGIGKYLFGSEPF